MNNKFKSSNITVYPAVAREGDSKYITELSLTSIFKHITDRDSFVIDYSDNIIEFMLKGYYFNLKLEGILTDKSEGLWVRLCMKTNAQELCGDTLEGEYGGLEYCLTSSEATPVPGEQPYFKLLGKEDNSNVLQVPMESKIKFNNTSVESRNHIQIKCGLLEEKGTNKQ